MSIRYKTYLVIGGMLAGLWVVGVSTHRLLMLPAFDQLERAEAIQEASRCAAAVRQETHGVHVACLDWARWDDTYQFAQDGNASYITSNLREDSLDTLGLSLLYVCDLKGRRVWAFARDADTGRRLTMPDIPESALPPSSPLLAVETDDGRCGVWSTPWGPMAVASAPITTSDRKSPANGVLIMGRPLSSAHFASLGRDLELDVQAWGVAERSWGPEQQATALRLSAPDDVWLADTPDGRLAAYRMVRDPEGDPALLLRVTIPKDITHHGQATMRLMAAVMVPLIVCFVLLTAVVTRRTIVAPIEALTQQVVAVGRSGEPMVQLRTDRRDEIGVLARQFDAMLERLAETRERLLRRSYQSGMDEMAAGVLHSLRNALAPAVVHLAEARERLRGIHPDRLAAAARGLTQADAEEQRREDLVSYVELAGTRLVQAVVAAEASVEAVSQQLADIERMLPDAEAVDAREPLTEVFTLDALAPEALAMVPSPLAEALATDVGPSLAEVGPVRAVMITCEQVLANVLANAAEARNGATDRPCRVALTASRAVADGAPLIDLQVTDDGPGIEADVLERLFEPGFSTKASSWGLGLHWCANAVHAMGGRMYAESPQAGRGARLHVLLPAAGTLGGDRGCH